MRPKRVLLCSEASYLSTGYAVYSREILTRLHKMGYDVIEFATYGDKKDPRCNPPWKFVGVMPENEQEAQIFNSNPAFQFGSYKFEQTCLDYQIDCVCVTPGSMVITEEGNKPIEEIKVGERVLTHDGTFQRVTKTFKNTHIGNIRKIGFRGQNIQLTITDNHPMYIFKNRKQGVNKKNRQSIYQGISPEFVPVQDVKVNDLRTFPQMSDTILKNHTVVIGDYLDKFYIENGRTCNQLSKSLPISIPLDEDFAEFLGYIITDGCVSLKTGGVSCTFHIEEERFCIRFLELCQKIFGISGKYKQSNHQKSFEIRVNSNLLRNFLHNFTNGKNIPKEIFTSPVSVKLALIKGMIRGDGYYSKNTISLTSVKNKLAFDFYWLVTLCGVTCNIGKYAHPCPLSKNKRKRKLYHVNIYGKNADFLRPIIDKYPWEEPKRERQRDSSPTKFINGYMTSNITNKAITHYKGQVYNLEVEKNNSYVVNNCCVHNCTINDPWIDKYKVDSPYRRIYSLIGLTTVDSEPQPQDWINEFEQYDRVLGYTQWGVDELKKRSTKIKLGGRVSAGADFNIFKPVPNKSNHKRAFGLDKFVIGTVMRNQKRKLFPDLIKSFDMLLNQNPTLIDSVALYLHTAWPDNGWNIPELIKDSKYPKNIYLTYHCQSCGAVYPDNYKEAVSVCKRCGQYTAILPNSGKGISTEAMAAIYNLMDVYVQYAHSEGQGLSQVEAAACGIPLFSVDYAGMSSVVKDCGGYPIRVRQYIMEGDKKTLMAVPDNQDLVDKLKKFYYLPEHEKQRKSLESRQKAIKYYNYDDAAKVWAKAIDESPYADWTIPPDIRKLPPQPQNLGPYQLVEWAIVNILGRADLVGSYYHTKLVKDINTQMRMGPPGSPHQRFGPAEMLNELAQIRMNINQWEERRVSTLHR